MNNVVFSHKSDIWNTPRDLFEKLNDEFKFTLDPCCNNDNKLCDKYYTEEDDGLLQSWDNEIVYCNPPYSNIKEWVRKAYCEWDKNTTIVLLLPSRTDTIWFHKYIYNIAEIRFIKGRLKFSNSKNSAPFPSMLVIYRKENK